jgi:hypothetical protein
MSQHKFFLNGKEVTRDLFAQITGVADKKKTVTHRKKTKWPTWAKALKKFSKPEDKGIGDVITRTIGDERSDAFKKWYKATFGKSCGCTGRQAKWNQMYPFTPDGKS